MTSESISNAPSNLPLNSLLDILQAFQKNQTQVIQSQLDTLEQLGRSLDVLRQQVTQTVIAAPAPTRSPYQTLPDRTLHQPSPNDHPALSTAALSTAAPATAAQSAAAQATAAESPVPNPTKDITEVRSVTPATRKSLYRTLEDEQSLEVASESVDTQTVEEPTRSRPAQRPDFQTSSEDLADAQLPELPMFQPRPIAQHSDTHQSDHQRPDTEPVPPLVTPPSIPSGSSSPIVPNLSDPGNTPQNSDSSQPRSSAPPVDNRDEDFALEQILPTLDQLSNQLQDASDDELWEAAKPPKAKHPLKAAQLLNAPDASSPLPKSNDHRGPISITEAVAMEAADERNLMEQIHRFAETLSESTAFWQQVTIPHSPDTAANTANSLDPAASLAAQYENNSRSPYSL